MKRSRRSATAVATAACLVAGIVASSAAAQSTTSKPIPTPPPGVQIPGLTPEIKALMKAEEPLDHAADRITALAKDTATSGLAGISIDAAHATVRLAWHGPLPADVAAEIAGDNSHGATVAVTSAPYTSTELLREAHRIGALTTSSKSGQRVAGVAPRPDGTGLDVDIAGLPQNFQAMVTQDASALVPGLSSTVPLHVKANDSAIVKDNTRQDDSAPYWAGGQIKPYNQGGCSSAFAVHNSTGSYLMTAAHCGWSDYYTGAGVFIGRTVKSSSTYDAQIFSANSGGYVYDGTSIADVSGSGQFAKQVIGTEGNYVGNYVCSSPAYTGVTCGIEITATHYTIPNAVSDTVVGKQVGGLAISGPGDSGGPMFWITGDASQDYARGIDSGHDPRSNTTCRGVPASQRGSNATCGSIAYYADFQSMEVVLGVQVSTN